MTAGGGCGLRWRSTSAMLRCRGDRRLPHWLAGGAGRCRAPALRRRLDRARPVRRLARARPGRGRLTFGYQRSEVLAALVNGLLLVAVGDRVAFAAIGRLCDPPGIDGWRRAWRSGRSAWPATSPPPSSSPRGERVDVNLEGVFRHSRRRRARLARRRRRRRLRPRRRLVVIDPIVGLLIAALVLASSWRLIKEPFDVLMEAAPPASTSKAWPSDLRGGGSAQSTTYTSGP